MNPWKWNNDICLWENSDTGETMTAEEWSAAQWKYIAQLEAELADYKEYADKLAEGFPEGMLPKDIELLKTSNTQLATQLQQVQAERDALRKDILGIIAFYRNNMHPRIKEALSKIMTEQEYKDHLSEIEAEERRENA